MNLLKNFIEFFVNQKKWFAIVGTGWSFDWLLNWSFEYILYPLAINKLGFVYGGGIMIVLSVAISLAVIRFYDFTKKDWLGIEAVKLLRDGENIKKNIIGKIVEWLMKKSDFVALVGLSLISEPVKVTLYLRRGVNKFNGFCKRDWIVFIGSTIITNFSWALLVFGGLEIFKAIFSER